MNKTSQSSTKRFARTMLSLCIASGALGVSAAHAGGTISIGPDKSISLGLGLRTSYTSASKGALNGTNSSSDFAVDSARLYVGASLSKNVKLTFNTEKSDASGTVKVLDAFGSLLLSPSFNIDAGRTIVPADRANLSGGYYMPAWEFASVASQYPSLIASRDDGVVAWGKFLDNKLVYSAGVFNGRNRGTSNQANTNMLAGRIAYNFWDAEPAPAYYTGSTYYGSVDILTVGLAGQRQKDAVGNANVKDTFSAWNIDALMEKKIAGAGVVTLEGAYYKYNFSTAAAAVDAGGMLPGKSYLVSAAYLIPGKVGWGQFQPFYRYQKMDADGTLTDTKQNDVGVNYIIDGANAKIATTYRTKKIGTALTTNTLIVGLQLQF